MWQKISSKFKTIILISFSLAWFLTFSYSAIVELCADKTETFYFWGTIIEYLCGACHLCYVLFIALEILAVGSCVFPCMIILSTVVLKICCVLFVNGNIIMTILCVCLLVLVNIALHRYASFLSEKIQKKFPVSEIISIALVLIVLIGTVIVVFV